MRTHKLSEQSVIISVEVFLQQGRRLSSHHKFPISNEYFPHALFSVVLLLSFRNSKYFTWPLFQSRPIYVLSGEGVTRFT
jgi:hypothetical protein